MRFRFLLLLLIGLCATACGGTAVNDPTEIEAPTSISSTSVVSDDSSGAGGAPDLDDKDEAVGGTNVVPATDSPGGEEDQSAVTQTAPTTEAVTPNDDANDGSDDSSGNSNPTTTEAPFNAPQSYEPNTNGGFTSSEPDA